MPVQLLVDVKRVALEVYAVPGKAQDLPLPHTGEQSDQEQQFIGVPLNRLQGGHLAHFTVYKEFKKIVCSIGLDNARFHDLRHSYAVAAIESGDDIKTVQGNLGHATAAFTLNIYAHTTQKMRQQSADRMPP